MKKVVFSKMKLFVFIFFVTALIISCGSDDPDPIDPMEPEEVVDPEPDPTNAATTIEATSLAVANGTEAVEITITLADTEGKLFTTSGGTLVLSVDGSAIVSTVTDNNNGTYSATVTNTVVETITVSGTLDGVAITNTAQIIFEPTPDPAESNEPVGPSVLRINCGGGEVTIDGVTFLEDQYFEGPTKSFVNESLTEIANTDYDQVFFTERVTLITNETDPFSYKIPIENGTYSVKLYWAEVYWGIHPDVLDGGIGSRVFNVSMEDNLIVEDFDLFEELGAATADTRLYDVEVTDGELTITFQSTVDRPKISAIEIFGNGAVDP